MALNPKRMRLFKVELKVNFIQRWRIPMQYEKVHAMQYKQSLLYFGTIRDNVQTRQHSILEYIVSGFSATPIDDEDNYLWFPLPQTSTHSYDILNNVVTYEHGIQFKVNQDALTLNLMDPSQQWSGRIQRDQNSLAALLISYQLPSVFNAFQKYRIEATQQQVRIINKHDERCTGHYRQLPHSNAYINCTCSMIKDDLYIIIKDKMVAIQNLDQKIIECEGDNNLSSDFEIAVPHSNSTPFVVQDVLFIVGGHDSHYEPFPDLYQFDHDTMSWLLYGRTTVSRYAAKVVVFKGRNEKESIFIVGGFKQNNDPCSVIERIPVEVS